MRARGVLQIGSQPVRYLWQRCSLDPFCRCIKQCCERSHDRNFMLFVCRCLLACVSIFRSVLMLYLLFSLWELISFLLMCRYKESQNTSRLHRLPSFPKVLWLPLYVYFSQKIRATRGESAVKPRIKAEVVTLLYASTSIYLVENPTLCRYVEVKLIWEHMSFHLFQL